MTTSVEKPKLCHVNLGFSRKQKDDLMELKRRLNELNSDQDEGDSYDYVDAISLAITETLRALKT